MKTNVRWMGPGTMRFIADTGSGHLIGMDGAPEGGGDKGRHDVRGCQVQLEADRADTDPKVFTRIKLHFIVRGRKLNPAHVERAIKLSHDKYCSATAMLAKTAAIETSWEIVEDLED